MPRRYHYDMITAYAAHGKALAESHDRRIADTATPDPSVSIVTRNALAKQIIKKINIKPGSSPTTQNISDANPRFCKPCRRLFDGIGDPVQRISSIESGAYYAHWDLRHLDISAARGCPLCHLVSRDISRHRPALAHGEAFPARYDYGGYGGGEGIFAIRFMFYRVLQYEGHVNPLALTPTTITLEKPTSFDLSSKDAVFSRNTDSQETIELLKNWLSICDASHNCLTPRADENHFLPSRLIDIGITCSMKCVRLVDKEKIIPNSRYATLSHCWGPSENLAQFSLNEKFLYDFKERIPKDRLPNTFAHAFKVTRAIGIRYLWIDSLCIIQDSSRDFKDQAAMMWEIYTNSYINLSATASTGPSEGLFRSRSSLTTKACFAKVNDNHPCFEPGEYQCYIDKEWKQDVDDAPVNTRAWVLQERLLSPRIVHFAEKQVYWECHELRASEKFPAGLPSRYEASTQRQFLRTKLDSKDSEKTLKIWDSVVKTYSKSRLTYVSDKLIAISALARQVSKSTSDSDVYLAGLWRNRLIDQLLWSPATLTSRSLEYRAPSWSWVCIDGPVFPNFNSSAVSTHYRSRWIAKVMEAACVPIDNSFGPVKSGFLRISGPLLEIRLVSEDSNSDSKSGNGKKLEKSGFEENDAELIKMVSGMTELPGYTGENLTSLAISDGVTGIPDSSRFKIDAKNGVLVIDDSANDRTLGPREYHVPFESQIHKGRARLDEINTKNSMPAYFMPLLAFNEINRVYNEDCPDFSSIEGLVLTPTGTAHGQYQRIGTCKVEGNACDELLCELGNQDPEDLPVESKSDELLMVDEFAPDWYVGQDISFIPSGLNEYVISIV